jgi:hypothetical protein
MFKFWNKVKEVDIVQYPNIKVGVQVGEIMLVADTVETIEQLMKMLPPIKTEG